MPTKQLKFSKVICTEDGWRTRISITINPNIVTITRAQRSPKSKRYVANRWLRLDHETFEALAAMARKVLEAKHA